MKALLFFVLFSLLPPLSVASQKGELKNCLLNSLGLSEPTELVFSSFDRENRKSEISDVSKTVEKIREKFLSKTSLRAPGVVFVDFPAKERSWPSAGTAQKYENRLSFVFHDGQRLNLKARRALIAHEFGHLLFTKNMGKYSDEWGAFSDRLESGTARNAKTPPGFDLSVKYEEVFSDLTAVVISGDAGGMAYYLKRRLGWIGSRDFKSKPKAIPLIESDVNALDAVRYFLGVRYLRDAKPKNLPRIAELVFEALAKDLLLAANSQDPEFRSVDATNARLIQALKVVLKSVRARSQN